MYDAAALTRVQIGSFCEGNGFMIKRLLPPFMFTLFLLMAAGCSADRLPSQAQRLVSQIRLASEASAPPADPANQLLVSGTDGNLFLVDAATGARFALTTDASPQRQYLQPVWSPDGFFLGFDEVLYMEGRGNFAYHQDSRFRKPDHAYRNLGEAYVQTGLAIDPHDPLSGGMKILPGSHLRGSVDIDKLGVEMGDAPQEALLEAATRAGTGGGAAVADGTEAEE